LAWDAALELLGKWGWGGKGVGCHCGTGAKNLSTPPGPGGRVLQRVEVHRRELLLNRLKPPDQTEPALMRSRKGVNKIR